jgi:hypothetical protein
VGGEREVLRSEPEDRDLNVTCAWCGVLISGRPDARLTSHGMCPACFRVEVATLEEHRKGRRKP